MTRLVLPVPQNELIRMNKLGELEGMVKQFEQAFILLIVKLNITWIPAKNAQTTEEIEIEGVKMIEQDKVDLALCHHFFSMVYLPMCQPRQYI